MGFFFFFKLGGRGEKLIYLGFRLGVGEDGIFFFFFNGGGGGEKLIYLGFRLGWGEEKG